MDDELGRRPRLKSQKQMKFRNLLKKRDSHTRPPPPGLAHALIVGVRVAKHALGLALAALGHLDVATRLAVSKLLVHLDYALIG